MNTPKLKLMAILAHPDDESMGMGSTLAKYAAEGVALSLVMATRGERGWQLGDAPEMAVVAATRTQELLAAADVLHIQAVEFLDYTDGDLDQADVVEVTGRIVSAIRRHQPQVIITFDPEGSYGHPDHIAISQLSAGAIVLAADGSYGDPAGLPAHRVSKLYYMVDTEALFALYQKLFGEIGMEVDGFMRIANGWKEWAITSWIDGDAYWEQAWQAIACHRSQLADFELWEGAAKEYHRLLIGLRPYYRVFSLVNGGRQIEDDLFDGLRGGTILENRSTVPTFFRG